MNFSLSAGMKSLLTDARARELSNLAQPLLNQPDGIGEDQFRQLMADYGSILAQELDLKRKEIVEGQTIARMKQLGYSPACEDKNGIVFFNTPDGDYRIMAKVNPANDQLSMRFVRVAGCEREKAGITTAQKRRDREKASQWRKHVDILAQLPEKESGIKLKEVYRVEPDDDVLAVVDSRLAATEDDARQAAGFAR